MRVNSTGRHASSIPDVNSGSVLFDSVTVELIMQHFVLFLSHCKEFSLHCVLPPTPEGEVIVGFGGGLFVWSAHSLLTALCYSAIGMLSLQYQTNRALLSASDRWACKFLWHPDVIHKSPLRSSNCTSDIRTEEHTVPVLVSIATVVKRCAFPVLEKHSVSSQSDSAMRNDKTLSQYQFVLYKHLFIIITR